ncbi:hypothetical protein ABW19_dt0210296 [Dactylella cylindrospora]|nr:hypothetical protein ABW19_dt0210296 [Dactylella cylindrospora]
MASLVGQKKRENIHTDIGMVGRKTGFTAKQNLQRDDDGMESVSAFFSSPAASEASHRHDPFDFDSREVGSDNEDDLDVESDEISTVGKGLSRKLLNPTPKRHMPARSEAARSSPRDESASMDVEESPSSFIAPPDPQNSHCWANINIILVSSGSARSLAGALQSQRGDFTLPAADKSRSALNTPAKRRSMIFGTPQTVLAAPSPAPLTISPRRPPPPSSRSSQPRLPTKTASASQEYSPLNEAPEDDLGSSKENFPIAHETKKLDRTKAVKPRLQQAGTAPSGLRSTSRNSRLLTRNVAPSHYEQASLRQQDEDDETGNSTFDDGELDIVPAPVAQPPQPSKLSTSHPNLGGKRANSAAETELPAPQKQSQKRGRKQNFPQHMTEREPTDATPGSLDAEPEPADSPENINNADLPARATAVKSAGVALVKQKKRESKALEPTASTRVPENPPKEPETTPKVIRPEAKRGRRLKSKPANEQPGPQEVLASTENDGSEAKTVGNLSEVQDGAAEKDGATDYQENGARKRGRKRKAQIEASDVLSTGPDPSGMAGVAEVIESQPKKKKRAVQVTAQQKHIPDTISGTNSPAPDAMEVRPKRHRIAPLQFWKNEKRVYTVKGRRESGTAVSLEEQVIRIEDSPANMRKKKRAPTQSRNTASQSEPGRKRRPRKSQEEDESSGEDSDAETGDEDWEGVGKLVGMVKQWPDSELAEIEDEIATSRNGIEFKPIFGSEYLFAKTLGKEFMGCGVLELRTGATKKLKSSGKMQLVFFILEGKVEAEVNELGFRIGKGGQFQVPRGNMYKISNPFGKTAKIFFAQACIPESEDD